MWFARRDASGHGAVVAAVDQVLTISGQGSVVEVARNWAQANGRVMEIEDAPLAAGVFGQWISFPDRDLVQIGQESWAGTARSLTSSGIWCWVTADCPSQSSPQNMSRW